MKIRILLITTIVCIAMTGFLGEVIAQQSRGQFLHQRLDSLKQHSEPDTTLIKTYFDLAHYYLRRDSSKTGYYAHRAYQIADSTNSELGRSIGHMALGMHHIIQGNYRVGLTHTYEAETILNKLNRDEYLAMVYSYNGIAYSRIGNNNKALRYYIRSDSLMKQTGSPMQKAQIKANIGIIYSSQGHHQETIRYFKEAMPVIEEYGAPEHVALGFHNIGVAFFHLSEYDSALVYLKEANELRKGTNDRFGKASTLKNIGRVYAELDEYNVALEHLNEAIELQKELGDQGILLTSYLDAAAIYQKLNKHQQAREYALNSLEIAKRIGDLKHEAEAMVLLSEVEEETGNIREAFNFLKSYHQLQDSLIQLNRTQAFEEMRVRYESEEMEQKIKHLQQEQAIKEAQLSKAQLFRNSLFGGVIALFIILVLLLMRYRAVKKYEKELQQKNKQLEALNEEKSEYLSIAAHDLKSPLSSILGLAEMIKDMESAPREVRQHANYIFISAFQMHELIKQFLDVNAIESGRKLAQPHPVNIVPSINKVIERYSYRANWKDIDINLELKKEELNAIADPLLFQEILENIVSNAVKYTPKGRQIWIKGHYVENSVRVEVKDQGPGLSEEDQQQLFQKFKRLTPEPTEGEGSTGLGLYITKKMVGAMNGSIWCECEEGDGCTFIVELKKAD